MTPMLNKTLSSANRQQTKQQPPRVTLGVVTDGARENAVAVARAEAKMHEANHRQKQLAAELAESRRMMQAHGLDLTSARQEAQQHKDSLDKVVAIASAKLSAANDAHESQVAELTAEVEAGKAALAQQREAANQIIADARNSATQSQERVRALTAENTAAEKTAHELRQSLGAGLGEMEGLQAQLAAQSKAHASELAAMKAKYDASQAELLAAAATRTELQSAVQQAAALKGEVDEREEELARRLASADEEAAAMRAVFQQDRSKLHAACSAAEAAAEQKQTTIDAIRSEFETQQQTLVVISSEVAKLEATERDLRSDIGTMAATMQEATDDQTAKQLKIDQLTTECSAAKERAAEADSLRAQLESQCTEFAAQETTMVDKHSEELLALASSHTSTVDDLRAQLEVKSMQLQGSKEGFASAMSNAEAAWAAETSALKVELAASKEALLEYLQMQEAAAVDASGGQAANASLCAERDALSAEVET